MEFILTVLATGQPRFRTESQNLSHWRLNCIRGNGVVNELNELEPDLFTKRRSET